MELWALRAAGCHELVRDAVSVRAVVKQDEGRFPGGLRSTAAALWAAGLVLEVQTSSGWRADVWGDWAPSTDVRVRPLEGLADRAARELALEPLPVELLRRIEAARSTMRRHDHPLHDDVSRAGPGTRATPMGNGPP